MSNFHPNRISPWGLTPFEAEAMDAGIKEGSNKGAARLLDVPLSTYYSRLREAQRKIGKRGRLLAFIEWDRWRRSTAAEKSK